jgi:hypothetical protein
VTGISVEPYCSYSSNLHEDDERQNVYSTIVGIEADPELLPSFSAGLCDLLALIRVERSVLFCECLPPLDWWFLSN